MVVSRDKSEALVSFVRTAVHLCCPGERIYLRGLSEEKSYRLSDRDGVLPGSVLMRAGLEVEGAECEYQSKLIYLREQADS